MEGFNYRIKTDSLIAKPKRGPTAEVINKRKLQREVRKILKDSAKDKAGRGGISPDVKREIMSST